MRQGDKGTRGQGDKETRSREEGDKGSGHLVTPSPCHPLSSAPLHLRSSVSVQSFLAALQFLTVVPPLVRRPFTSPEMGRAVGYFPLVGLLLGGLLIGLNRALASHFPTEVTAALLLATWVIVTGVLHLDGLLDACDGLFGGKDPETRLRILRDEQVGAFALAGGVLVLLTKYAALTAMPRTTTALLLAPALGRWGMAMSIAVFPYARPEGVGRAMKDHAGWGQVTLATGFVLVAAWFTGGGLGLIAMGVAGAVTWLVAHLALDRLPGLTGDVYGATCEVVETAILLTFVAGGGF